MPRETAFLRGAVSRGRVTGSRFRSHLMLINLSNHSQELQERRKEFQDALSLWERLPEGPDLRPSDLLDMISSWRVTVASYRQEFRRMLAGKHEGQCEMFGELEAAARSCDRDRTLKVAGCLLRALDRCAEQFDDDYLVQTHYGLAAAILGLHYYLAFRPRTWPRTD